MTNLTGLSLFPNVILSNVHLGNSGFRTNFCLAVDADHMLSKISPLPGFVGTVWTLKLRLLSTMVCFVVVKRGLVRIRFSALTKIQSYAALCDSPTVFAKCFCKYKKCWLLLNKTTLGLPIVG